MGEMRTRCDLTDAQQIEAMREQIERELGPADIVVANAGGNPVLPGPIEQLTEGQQAGPAGVRVNCMAPETILTERNQKQIPDNVKEQLRATHPIQRFGTPDDVAHAALYLASDRAGWVSGITLDVAGGAVLRRSSHTHDLP
jgi:NAD(P)-dependent dehydrogenase (short-subunit alcohol dehydrogenase family)